MEVWVSVCVCVCVYGVVCGSTSPGQFGCLVFSLFDAPRALRTLQNITQRTLQPMGEFLFPSCLFYCTYFWAARHMAGSVTTVRPVETKTSSICKASGPTPGISPNTCGAGRRQKVK